ncbi:MAG: cation transporter [Armatimonadetes bacterium]|nr:cation transporter [Armatimonadota bacterium]
MHSYDDNARKMTPPQLAAVTAVGVSLLAFLIKFLLGRASGSMAVAAAAWHVAAGLLYALLMLGILHSPEEQPEVELSGAEREYLQYQSGLQVNIKRHEAFLALFGSMGLLAVAYLIFSRVLAAKVSVPEQTTLSLLGLAVVFFAMQFLGRFTERIGLEHATPGLVATSFHARTDAFATLLAGLALVTVAMGFQIERFFAALIGLLLVADAAQLFVDATRRIVGLEDDSPTAQLPFWVRLRDALRAYAQDMPPIVRWLLRYDDALSAAELRQARRWAIGVVGVVYLLTGFRTVELGEVGGVKYLGRYHGLAHPGPVYALWPFASVRVVPVDRIQRVSIGFTTAASWSPHQENRAFGEMLWQNDEVTNQLFKVDPEKSKFMLGDTTQVETHVSLTYRVNHDAVGRYLFGIERPEKLVQLATEQAIQELMLTRGLDQVLVENRAAHFLMNMSRSLTATWPSGRFRRFSNARNARAVSMSRPSVPSDTPLCALR